MSKMQHFVVMGGAGTCLNIMIVCYIDKFKTQYPYDF